MDFSVTKEQVPVRRNKEVEELRRLIKSAFEGRNTVAVRKTAIKTNSGILKLRSLE